MRPGALGDCILALPAMRHLCASASECEVWITAAAAPLVDFAPRVRPLSSTAINLVGLDDSPVQSELAAYLQTFDSIVSWYGTNRKEFRLALRELGVPCTFLRALPPPEMPCHASAYFSGQVGAPTSELPRIAVAASERRRSIVIQPFSGSPSKNWPLSHYRDLAQMCLQTVEWLAGVDDPLLVGALQIENLRELVDWLAGADLYIGNDSGITHLAAACGVKTMALFGPTDPAMWAPRGPNVTVLRGEPLESLTPQTVLDCVNRLLGSPSTLASSEQ